jgi:hypothetical protein
MYFRVSAELERDPLLFDTWMNYTIADLPDVCVRENVELLPGAFRRYDYTRFDNTIVYAWPIAYPEES